MLNELPSECIMLIIEFLFYIPKQRRCIAQTAKGKMCSRKKKKYLFCNQHYMCLITDTSLCRVILRTLIVRLNRDKNRQLYYLH